MVTIECSDNGTLTIDNYGWIPFTVDVMFTIQEMIIKCCPEYHGLAPWNGVDKSLSAGEAAIITGTPTGFFMSIWYFNPYTTDILMRNFQIWKIPLLQLLVQFPRPPYGTAVELMSLFHLLGDPIDTIASLIFTLQVTQNRLRAFKANIMDQEKLKKLTLLVVAFEEAGYEENAARLEEEFLLFTQTPSAHSSPPWTRGHEDTARNLAADRVTKLLPILFSVLGFVVTVGLSYGKKATEEFNSRDPPHLATYGIAFCMTLSGCVPAVVLAATVGSPQTRHSASRLLSQFKKAQSGSDSGDEGREEEPAFKTNGFLLPHKGAVPSWRFDRWIRSTDSCSVARKEAIQCSFWRECCAVLMVLIGSVGAIALSASVPPAGCINCRINSELVIVFSYLSSYVLGVAFSKMFKQRGKLHFWLVVTKDVCSTLVITAVILLTSIGSLNRPSCWETCDGKALCLPEMTRDVIQGRLKSLFPAIIFLTFSLLAVLLAVTAILLRDGISVYLQRDEGESTRALRKDWHRVDRGHSTGPIRRNSI